MPDYNVDDFSKSDFVAKEELKTNGPRQKQIASVEQRDGLPKNGIVKPELVLSFADGTKFGLRTRVNRDELREAFGKMTSSWIGKTIELYYDASVRNPQGAKVGGIRIRIPEQDAGPVDFKSDLDESERGESELESNGEKVSV